MIVPKFSTPNQTETIRLKKQVYATLFNMKITFLDKLTEYHKLMEFLENNCELNRDLIEKLIVRFFNTILHLCREKNCEYKIEKFIEILYNDLIKIPMVYHVKEYLTGISLEDENYQIEENLNIRRAMPNDFECNDIGEYINELERYSFQFPPVILGYNYISGDYNEYYNDFTTPIDLIWELENLDWALVLFRSAPIFRLKTESEVISIFTRGKTTSQVSFIKEVSNVIENRFPLLSRICTGIGDGFGDDVLQAFL